MKKRFIILNLLVVAVVLATLGILLFNGSHYTLHTHCMFGDGVFQEKDFSVAFDKEGVLTAGDFRLENEELVIPLDSAGNGRVNMTLTHFSEETDEEGLKVTFSFYVTHTGMIIEDTNGVVNFTGSRVIIVEFVLVLLAIMVVMALSFVLGVKKGEFSYPLIAYGGFTLFSGLLLMLLVYKMLNNVVDTLSDVVVILETVGGYFLLAMTPLMVIMALGVSVSNVSLMRHEGRRPVNALGIVASIVWLMGTGVMVLLSNLMGWMSFSWLYHLWLVSVYVLCYFESMIVSTSLCAYLATLYKPAYDKDYILILGCAIRDDGSLTPLLKGRVDRAIRFEKEQFEKTGRHAIFVPSGGQGADEVISEGEAMERYLLAQGIPADRILREDKSVNTNQNFGLSYEVIRAHDEQLADKKLAFATTNYHIFRGYILSAKNGFRAEGLSAKTKWYFFPNAYLREFIGLLYDQRRLHILFLLLIILLAILL